MHRYFLTPTICLACITYTHAQPTPKSPRLPLALELFDAYGARENLSKTVNAFVDNLKSKDPSVPPEVIACFFSKEALDDLFEASSEPLLATFSDDELKFLASNFRTPTFQKILHPKPGESSELSPQEQDSLTKFRATQPGAKFGREWPSIKPQMEAIFRRWIKDTVEKAQRIRHHPQPMNQATGITKEAD